MQYAVLSVLRAVVTVYSTHVNKNDENKEIQTEEVTGVEEKEVNSEKEDKFICTKEISDNNAYIEDDKVVIKLAQCTEEEGKEYEDKVELEMDLRDLLKDLVKGIESGKNIEQEIVEMHEESM